MNFLKTVLLPLVVISLLSACSITKHQDITYDSKHDLKLDVYSPKQKHDGNVMIFVHGGNWNAGEKSTYKFFGKAMAKKGIVTAVIDYRLAPKAKIKDMASDVAHAVKYMKAHATEFGGDSAKIFLGGHSAGGQLAALVANDSRYFNSAGISNPLKGQILIDAFGLNMDAYLRRNEFPTDTMYYPSFGSDKDDWKEISPITYLSKDNPPILIMVGGWTYRGITRDNYEFWDEAKKTHPGLKLEICKRKRHAWMILQFAMPLNTKYKKILRFMDNPNPAAEIDMKL